MTSSQSIVLFIPQRKGQRGPMLQDLAYAADMNAERDLRMHKWLALTELKLNLKNPS